MILIGMFDSPFVRRVAITLKLYGMDYLHRSWSVFRDADLIAEYNPLIRVPTLVLDDGEVLIETLAILDGLDEIAGDQQLLCPASGAERRRVLKICALAGGAAEKLVSLVYERAVHDRSTPEWEARCKRQVDAVLNVLESAAAERDSQWLAGEKMSHADIAVATTMTFMKDALPDLFDLARWPSLNALRETCEASQEFLDHHQVFFPPPPRST